MLAPELVPSLHVVECEFFQWHCSTVKSSVFLFGNGTGDGVERESLEAGRCWRSLE